MLISAPLLLSVIDCVRFHCVGLSPPVSLADRFTFAQFQTSRSRSCCNAGMCVQSRTLKLITKTLQREKHSARLGLDIFRFTWISLQYDS